MISNLIVHMMNEAWSRKHGHSRSCCPFDELVVVNPQVPQQTKADSSFYTCLFALGMFKTRNQPFFDEHYESNLTCLTESFTFGPADASRVKREMKACILFLQSKSSELSHCQWLEQGPKSMNRGLKSIKQPHVTPSIPVVCKSTQAKTVQQTQTKIPVVKRELDKNNLAANRKRDERRFKYHFNIQLPKLKANGRVLPSKSQRQIKIWVGGYDGSFENATQLTMPAEITTYENKKVTFDGVIVQRSGHPRWNLFAVTVSRIQVHRPVYFQSYIATQKTGWMEFEQDSVPVAVIRCNNETKLVSKSSISDVAPSQMRQKKSPDRLRSDSAGELTWKESSSSKKNKSVTPSCSENQFYQVYGESFCRLDASRCARDPKVQRMLGDGNINKAISESLRLKGRARDSHGNIVGAIASKSERAYAAVNADHEAKTRLKFTLLFEVLSSRRSLDMESTLPTGTPPPRRLCRSTRSIKKASEESKIKKRPPSPPSTTASKRPKQKQTQCKYHGCNKFALRMYYPFCNLHKTNVKICSKCHKNECRHSGGLCRNCFKKSFSKEELLEARRCSKCKVRFSRQIGGRCNECVLDGKRKA